jgi:hypothetical protein
MRHRSAGGRAGGFRAVRTLKPGLVRDRVFSVNLAMVVTINTRRLQWDAGGCPVAGQLYSVRRQVSCSELENWGMFHVERRVRTRSHSLFPGKMIEQEGVGNVHKAPNNH